MRKTLLAVTLASATVGAAMAAPVTYEVDPQHTYPQMSYTHMGLSTQTIRFNSTTGAVTYDKEAKTAEIQVSIDMKSVDTGSEVFDDHIQDVDLFDTAQHHTATFKSTRVQFEGDKPSSIEGDLTVNGITRPVTLTVTHFVNKEHPMLKKDAIGANATATIRRSEFKAGKFVPGVSDEVALKIAIEAVAKQ